MSQNYSEMTENQAFPESNTEMIEKLVTHPDENLENNVPAVEQLQMERTKNNINTMNSEDKQYHNHIYSSPVYDQKVSMPKTLEKLNDNPDLQQVKLITHKEFQEQLKPTNASLGKSNTLESCFSKKQRFPPKFIKMQDSDASSMHFNQNKTQLVDQKNGPSRETCEIGIPIQIVLGIAQLILAISLIALGSLLILRDGALSMIGCGIWAGLMAAITGSLGVMYTRKTQTPFLALSLICIATSTLAVSISGIALSRDINHTEQKIDIFNTNSKIFAVGILIICLSLHLIVSIISVYRCALQSRSSEKRKEIIVPKYPAILDKSDPYMRGVSVFRSDERKSKKLSGMWMNTPRNQYTHAPSTWTPASAEKKFQTFSNSPRHNIPQGVYLIPAMSNMPANDNGLYAYPDSTFGTCQSVCSTYRKYKRPNYRAHRKIPLPTHKILVKQRCKSESNILEDLNQEAFQYKGLDRAIADNFLAQQTSNSNMKNKN